MKLIPFRKAIAMSKEALDKALVPIRARQAKQQGELKLTEIEEKILTLETQIQELCVKHPLDYDALIHKLDEVGILERRQKQVQKIIEELFEDEAGE